MNNEDLDDSRVVERLDQLITLVRLAFQEPLAEARSHLRADPVNAAILDACAGKWKASGDLRRIVMKKTGATQRTFNRRLSELVELGVLKQRGATASRAYLSVGVV